MNSVLEKYFSKKRDELIKYTSEIIPMFSYASEVTMENKVQTVKKILNIYYKKYYKVSRVNYDIVTKHYRFDDEIDKEFKTIIQCVIEYYDSIKENIAKNNTNILYLSYIIYFAFLINRLRDTILIMPNKNDFLISIANKVSANFKYTKNDRFKKHVNNIISLIKQNIKYNKKINEKLNHLVVNDEHNEYISINDEANLYKIKYNYKINELKDFKEKNINKVCNKENINGQFKIMSYELSLITLLRCILNDQRVFIALELDRDFYKMKTNINNLIKLLSNRYTIEYTKVIIKSSEYEKNSNLELLKSLGVKILIDSDKYDDIKSIEFDDNTILITNQDFITKYKEDLDAKKIKYIKKTTERVYKEKDLFFTKVDFMEV